MDETQAALRILILAATAAIVALCAVAWWRRPARRVLSLPPAFWATQCFYTTTLWGDVTPAVLNYWWGVLWLHAAVLVLAGVWLFLWPARGRG